MQTTKHTVRSTPTLQELLNSVTEACKTDVPMCDPPCACPECETHFYSLIEQEFDRWHYAGTVNNSQASDIIQGYANRIERDRQYLLSAIQDHGDKLLSRWRKRSSMKRAALLGQLDPNMPKKKWMIARLEYAMMDWKDIRKNYRHVYLLPYLDVETLAKDPCIPLGIVNYRACSSPDEWAQHDHHELTTWWACGSFDTFFNQNSVVMYGQDYGKLVPWTERAAHQSDHIGFPRARLVFEKQAYLMRFLRNIVEALLGDIATNEPCSSRKWKELMNLGLKKSGDASYWSNFTFHPFSAPPVFNIDNLLAQATARLEATGDHLWLLQTEPSYMRRYTSLLGQMHLVAMDRTSVFGPEMIGCEIVGDLDMHRFWQGVVEELEYARDVFHRHRDSIFPGNPLPKEVDQALGALEVLLVNEVHTRSMQLQAIIPQRPGFHHWYEFDRDIKTGNTTFSFRPGVTTAGVFKEDPLWWCLMQSLGAPDDQQRFPYPMMLKFLDDHLASSPIKERSRLDEILFEKLSDYATIMELLAAVRMHHPKCTIRNLYEIKENANRLAWRRYKGRKVELPKGYVLGQPLKQFLTTTPPSGRRDQKWLHAFDANHETLQRFWGNVYDLHQSHFVKHALAPQDIETSMRPVKHWNSPEYRTLLEIKRREILAGIVNQGAKFQASNDLFLPLPSLGETPSRFTINAPNIKVKTKGEGALATINDIAAVVDRERHSTPVALTVSKRTLGVLRSMFPATVEERQISIDWDTFVQSMGNAGFSSKNGGGSIVTFEQMNGSGKIIFHRPHPIPKIDTIMLQSMGRRMNKWFGWSRETFVLAGK